jgi:hypothetical protein
MGEGHDLDLRFSSSVDHDDWKATQHKASSPAFARCAGVRKLGDPFDGLLHLRHEVAREIGSLSIVERDQLGKFR